jgi:WD40 repeat protein
LALSSTIHPSRIYICSVIINEERNHADHFKVEIIHHFDSCHDKPILSLDWSDSDDNKTSACTNGRIVSCAEDCRAFIWVFDDHRGMWKSTQIFLNNCLAPLYCKWSRGGEKVAFAMGGDKKSASLHVCSFDVKTQEWMSRPVGKQQIKASALHLSWRPIIMGEDGNTQEFLASGGCDYKCRIFRISNDKHEER